MYRCIEEVMLSEFLIDLAALIGALRPKHRLRSGRLLLAAALGGAFSGAMALFDAPQLIEAAAALLFMPFMAVIACGRQNIAALGNAVCALAVSSALISAAVHILPWDTYMAAAAAAVVCAVLISRRRRWLESWDVMLNIITENGICCLHGIIDTGNRLTEPLSSLPVLVAGYSDICCLLPDDFDASEPAASLPRGFRLVPYGALGGNGCLGCFMPERILIDCSGRTKVLRSIWVAVYPGKLPGGHGALLPPITDV